MKSLLAKLLLFCFLVPVIQLAFSQVSGTDKLTLERIFASREFSGDRLGQMEWLADGSGYTSMEFLPDYSGFVIAKYDAKTGERTLLVDAGDFIPEGGDTPLDVDEYTWSPDHNSLLLFANTSRVWRLNSKGDYWILDLKTKKLKQIGKFAEPSNLKFAKFSPEGKKIAYVYFNNIYVEDLTSGKVTRLTDNGSETLINGTFDWVYEEEFFDRDGFRWSPDSKHIAYWQMDASVIREFYMINNTDSLYPFIITVPYPKVGQKLSTCRVGIIPAAGGETVWMKTDEDLRNNYIPRMEWAANSEEIVFQYMNRLQNRDQVILGDIKTGNIRVVLTETDAAWVEVVDDFQWLDGGKYFTWTSERSGWRHVYIVSRDGKEIKPVTKGDFDVISVEMIDEKGGYLYFIASPDNPTERYLFRTKLSGDGQAERLSPAVKGHHSYSISPNARWAIHSWSDINTPPVTDLVSLPKHKPVRVLVSNDEIKVKLRELNFAPVEFFRVDIGDIELDGYMLKPRDFDPSKKYPVLFHVYGEPAGSTVQNRFGGRTYLWYEMFAEHGYIIMSVDNRGTNVPRGREWRKCIYKQIGVLASADQAKAAQKIGEWSFVDKDRLAIWGWSGGGSMTLNALLQYPEIYNTGISVASVPDQRLYDAIYQERYMQTPDLDPEGFKKGSPITYAKNLKGNLLIIHGTGDDNVHYQGMEKLVNEFIKYNRQFTMMAYPNRSHGIYEGEGTTMHLYTLMTNYLLEKMPPDSKK